MTFYKVVLSSLYFWTLLTGLFAGFAAAYATILPSRTAEPAKTRRRKPTKMFFSLSAAVASATLGLFYSEYADLHNARLYWTLGASFLAGSLGLRFKRAAGIPLVSMFLVVYLLLQFIHLPWKPVRGVVELTSIKILRLTPAGMSLTVDSSSGGEEFLEFPVGTLTVKADFLKYDPLYELLGRKGSYKAPRLLSSDDKLSPVLLEKGDYEPATEVITKLPGVEPVQLSLTLEKPRLFSAYQVVLDGEGRLRLKEN